MKINRSNYEAYFIDYLDGSLDKQLVDELLDFLNENPDLAEELQAVSSLKLEAAPVSYSDKSSLLKPAGEWISPEDEQAIAFLEGDLSAAEKDSYAQKIAEDDAAIARLQVFQKTKLQADPKLVYPDKDQLQHRSRKVMLLWVSRVAALLLLFFASYAVVNRLKLPEDSVAVVEQPGTITEDETKPEEPRTKVAETPDQQVARNTETSSEKRIENTVAAEPAPKTTTPAEMKTQPEQVPTAAVEREPVPDQLTPIDPDLSHRNFLASAELYTDDMLLASAPKALTVDEYIAYKLLDAPKGESIKLSDIANAGLKAAESLAKERFDVQRTESGQVKHIKFSSPIIGFSIPVKKRH